MTDPRIDHRAAIGPPAWLKDLNADLMGQQEAGALPYPLPVLVVAGRRSGRPRRTPLTVYERGDERFVLGGFPAADWIRNVRAAGGRAVLETSGVQEPVQLVELAPDDAVPVLREWPEVSPDGVGMMRDAGVVADTTPAALAEAAGICPVFRVEGVA